ncbi:hypothetical protein KA012_02565 [Candidatus Woesebacteria bacterium]|nr:hypothetical protein [Candidatus Woesebacteria bacterium]
MANKEAANRRKQAERAAKKSKEKEEDREEAKKNEFISRTFARYESYATMRLKEGKDRPAAEYFSILVMLDKRLISSEEELETYLKSPSFTADATANLALLQSKRKIFMRRLDTMREKNQDLLAKSRH